MKRTGLKSKKFIYVALVAVVIAAGVIVAAYMENKKTTSSPQYSIYKLNQAVEKGDKAEFEKYYAVKDPGQTNSNPGGDSVSALEQYKEDYYVPLSLDGAKKAKTIDETKDDGEIIYLPKGDKEVVVRMEKENGVWKVVDIVKVDKVKSN